MVYVFVNCGGFEVVGIMVVSLGDDEVSLVCVDCLYFFVDYVGCVSLE